MRRVLARISRQRAKRGLRPALTGWRAEGGSGKAIASRGAQAYLTVRRARWPRSTQPMPSDPRPQPRAGEKCALALVLGLALVFTGAAPPAGAAPEELVIGYLALKKDPRYARKRTYARFLTQALGSPYPAAKGRDRRIPFRGRSRRRRIQAQAPPGDERGEARGGGAQDGGRRARITCWSTPRRRWWTRWRAPPATGTFCCSTSLRATTCSGRRSAGPTCCT